MNTLEQLRTAIGEPLKRKLGEQEFEFYPLDVTELVNFYDISERVSKESMTKQDMIDLADMIIKMVKKAFPNKAPENGLPMAQERYDDSINQLVIKYFFQLQEILNELHSPDVDKLSPQQKSKIEQLKELRAKRLENANLGTDKPTG